MTAVFLTVDRLENDLREDLSLSTILSNSGTYIWFVADLDGTLNENPSPARIDLAAARMVHSMDSLTDSGSTSETSRHVEARLRSVSVRGLDVDVEEVRESLQSFSRDARIVESDFNRFLKESAEECLTESFARGFDDDVPSPRRRFFSDMDDWGFDPYGNLELSGLSFNLFRKSILWEIFNSFGPGSQIGSMR